MENKQTAVEWLVSELTKPYGDKFINKIIEQAKEMEKQQIKCAYLVGSEDEQTLDYYPKEHSEQYYNETYGKL